MKKVRQFLSAIAIASVVVASLAGCGGGDTKTTEAGTAGTTEAAGSEAAGSEAANDTAAADTGDAETFLIGGIGPLTGAAASYGTSVKQGAEIAIKEVNDAGGVKVGDKTYKFALEFADDEATEDKATQAYNSLMDKGINAVMGGVTSGACMAIVDQTLADGILQITPSGSADGCIANDNAFRICFSDQAQGVAMADYAVDTLSLKKIAVIYNAADEYSTGLQTAFEEEVKAKGAEIVASEAFQTNDVEFNTQLTKIKGTDADAIYVPAYYQDVTYITKQAADMGIDVQFIGSDGWDGVLDTVTDKATVEGCIFSSPFCATVDDSRVQNFVKAYQDAYKATPDQFAADAYDTVYTFKAAMEKAGSVESADLIAAMPEISVDGLTGEGMTFEATGSAVKAVKFVEVKDGAYKYTDN